MKYVLKLFCGLEMNWSEPKREMFNKDSCRFILFSLILTGSLSAAMLRADGHGFPGGGFRAPVVAGRTS
jgi:hypothetical protein